MYISYCNHTLSFLSSKFRISHNSFFKHNDPKICWFPGAIVSCIEFTNNLFIYLFIIYLFIYLFDTCTLR